jgi:YVTN family beta-propeller protein
VSTWPAHAIFSRDARLLYVSGETAGDLTVIDVKTRTTVARIVHGGGDAMGLALAPDGRTLYAGAGENKQVVKIDTATHKVTGTIAVPGIIHETTLTLDGKFLYTTLRKANKVVVINTADDKIVATIPQKGYPDLVVMEPTGRYAYVTNRWAHHVAVIDVATHNQLRTIPLSKAPHGMWLRPLLSRRRVHRRYVGGLAQPSGSEACCYSWPCSPPSRSRTPRSSSPRPRRAPSSSRPCASICGSTSAWRRRTRASRSGMRRASASIVRTCAWGRRIRGVCPSACSHCVRARIPCGIACCRSTGT